MSYYIISLFLENEGEKDFRELPVCKKDAGVLEYFSLKRLLKKVLNATKVDIVAAKPIEEHEFTLFSEEEAVYI